MFLERAKIGYICWLCSADTKTFSSDSEYELCERCDATWQSGATARTIEARLFENRLLLEDDPSELIPTTDLKIKVLTLECYLEFIDWLNVHAGKGKWRFTVDPTKEIINNKGRSTFHVQLFVPYKQLPKDYKSKWGENVQLVNFSHMSKNGQDFRYSDDFEGEPGGIFKREKHNHPTRKKHKPVPPEGFIPKERSERAVMWRQLNGVDEDDLDLLDEMYGLD